MSATTGGYTNNNAVWYGWADATATSTAITGTTWGYWCDNGTTTTTCDTTWRYWAANTGYATTTAPDTVYYGVWNAQVEVKKLTKAERKAAAAAEEERRRVYAEQQRLAAERVKQAQEAQQRAEQLLLEHLTPEQEQSWKEERAIFVTSQSGKQYKLEGREHGSMFELKDGKPIKSFCVHAYGVPAADSVFAKMLALKYQEEHILKVANWHNL